MSSPVSQKPASSQETSVPYQGRVKKTSSAGARVKISTPQIALKTDQMQDAIPTNTQSGSESPKSPKLKTHSHAPTGIDFHQLKLAEGKRTFSQDTKD